MNLCCAVHHKVSALETNEKSSSTTPDFNFPSFSHHSFMYEFFADLNKAKNQQHHSNVATKSGENCVYI